MTSEHNNFLTIISREVGLRRQTAANLPKDAISDSIPTSFNINQHLFRLSYLAESDWSWPDSKVDQVMSSFGFPAARKSLRKTRNIIPWSSINKYSAADRNACALCYCLGYFGLFVWDTSPKSIDREGLGESRNFDSLLALTLRVFASLTTLNQNSQGSLGITYLGIDNALGLVTWKEQCHEDFAVLGQFCAKIITL